MLFTHVHPPATTIGLLICLALCCYIFWASTYYFFRVKSIWRWIKLAYAFNAAVVATFLLGDILDLFIISETMLILLAMTLLSTIASGLMVAQAKLSVIKRMPPNELDN